MYGWPCAKSTGYTPFGQVIIKYPPTSSFSNKFFTNSCRLASVFGPTTHSLSTVPTCSKTSEATIKSNLPLNGMFLSEATANFF